MKTLITGSSGLVGSALVEYLFKKGHSIQCLKQNQQVDSGHFWATDKLPENSDSIYQNIIHLAGENVAQGRWTLQKKQQILMSRLIGTKELVDYISMLKEKPNIFLCASAIGYYGSRGDEILDENSSLGDGFLADVCRQWEKETQRLSMMGIRVVNLRFGMILSPRGGALLKMIEPFRARLGGVIGNGKQYISWISIRDIVQIVDFIMSREHIKGPVNVVSPIQTTNGELTKALGKALNRPTPFRIPAFMARLLLGQMADEMLLSSTRVTPKVLLESGYKFSDQSLDAVLRNYIEGK
jgi:hypothetical protein